MSELPPLDASVLPQGVRARFVRGINGLRVHVLEAGFDPPGRPCVLLLHGFPELAFSWRKVMPALAGAGFHVVAPDQRGYGRTTGWDADYDADISPFRLLNLACDALGLVFALGHRRVAAVVGHDFGSPVAAWCALTRPDVFRRVALMSAPFTGPPDLPFGGDPEAAPAEEDVHAALARLDPPRKHYQWYFSTRAANADMHHPPQGLHNFLRAYYHHKSGDWPGNQPFPLAAWSATELAKLPRYYVMHQDRTMPESVEMPSADQIAVGSNRVYAAIHQFGGTIVPKTAAALVFRLGSRVVRAKSVTIPQRPYLGFGPKDQRAVLDVVSNELARAFSS